MDYFKSKAIEEFKERVKYIGAFVNGALPKNIKIAFEELPDKNPENENHITLFYLDDVPDIGEELFDDILNLPESFTVNITGYGYDKKNQGVSVSSREYDFTNIHLYGNRKAVPHITYSWDEKAGGAPVKTGKLVFADIPELSGTVITMTIKAYLKSGEMIPIQYFRDRAAGVIPSLTNQL